MYRFEIVLPEPISILQLWPRRYTLSLGSVKVRLTLWFAMSIELSLDDGPCLLPPFDMGSWLGMPIGAAYCWKFIPACCAAMFG